MGCSHHTNPQYKIRIKHREQLSPTPENILHFKWLWVQTRHICKHQRRITWQRSISSLKSHTPSRLVWSTIKKHKEKDSCRTPESRTKFTYRSSRNWESTFEMATSLSQYYVDFQLVRAGKESTQSNFQFDNLEACNTDFSMRNLNKHFQSDLGPRTRQYFISNQLKSQSQH